MNNNYLQSIYMEYNICDAGSRLLFKFRSGMHGLNEELGRHRGREGKTECSLYNICSKNKQTNKQKQTKISHRPKYRCRIPPLYRHCHSLQEEFVSSLLTTCQRDVAGNLLQKRASFRT